MRSPLSSAHLLSFDEAQKHRGDELTRAIEAKAATGAAKYLPLVRQPKDGSWIDGFLTLRDDFEFAEVAHEVMAAFPKLRTSHEGPAEIAFSEARWLFQQDKQHEGYTKYREIVQSYYASSLYRTVKPWLSDRK